MKLLVIGLDSAVPDLMFGDERLTNFRRLMEAGCYGRLETVIPPITVPAWMCMATSQDPGSLGVYGFRNRTDHSYDGLGIVNSRSIQDIAIWDQVAREGKRANIIGVPPSYPPRKVNGICVGCFLTPDTNKDTYTQPPSVKESITGLVGEYPVDVKGFRTDRKDWLKDEIYAMSRKHFEVVRHLLTSTEWDYFQFVEIGLDRLQHGFWKYHDPEHVLHVPGNPYEEVIRDYYLYLDDELGRIFECLSEDTAILVLSDHGAQRLDGGFCINEWLVGEGLLVLNEYPKEITPFSKLDVNWEKTRVWSEGGYYARLFFNVRGREPNGAVDKADYEKLRDEVKLKLEATVDDRGDQMGTMVFKPEEIYRNVRNVAPDLIAHFGGLYWRSIGGVGYRAVHVQENDTGPDDCNHSQYGSFILAASNSPLSGDIEGT
ncbi:MAG TPA: alkaline phosphatase family protein, partial [Blastocatellia bacterium]|nr:alkaline phosphatase family protein [Blastocatellia bacterium]